MTIMMMVPRTSLKIGDVWCHDDPTLHPDPLRYKVNNVTSDTVYGLLWEESTKDYTGTTPAGNPWKPSTKRVYLYEEAPVEIIPEPPTYHPEYLVLHVLAEVATHTLNAHVADGWELVSSNGYGYPTSTQFVLVRYVKD